MSRTFESLIREAEAADVAGWDFSWLDGRATEERPSWGYQRLLGGRLASATAALDLQTGGGEVLAGAGPEHFPATLVATEDWSPNLQRAASVLRPLGVVVVGGGGASPLPFASASFDLVTSRHPARVWWSEIARVLCPGGSYFAQHVGGGANVEVTSFFIDSFEPGTGRDHGVEAEAARAAGLEVVDCRNERLGLQFFDVGAVVDFLRKVIWTVPGFSVDRDIGRLRAMHERIERDGAFPSTTSRTLFEVRKPD